jgi:rod shape-determining protein MreC
MDRQPPPFFNRGPAPLARLSFFMLLAILLMVVDARFHAAESLRTGLAVVIYPLQRAAGAPLELLASISDYFSSLSSAQRENAALRTKVLQNARDVLALEALAAENAQLRRLLDARERVAGSASLAEIMYAGRDPFSRKVVIDKGSQQGLVSGQPVIDETGVIGQVTRVFPMLAEVTLITDKNQAIPLQVVRNGLRALAYGDGAALDLRFVAANADIQNGDVLVTSGIDGIYPAGLPVARVSRVERDAAYAFARIQCVPIAGTERHRQVLVIAHDAGLPPAPEAQVEQTARPTKGRRIKKREQ